MVVASWGDRVVGLNSAGGHDRGDGQAGDGLGCQGGHTGRDETAAGAGPSHSAGAGGGPSPAGAGDMGGSSG